MTTGPGRDAGDLPPPATARITGDRAEAVAAGLRHPGYVVVDDALPAVVVAALADELTADAGALRPAGVGRAGEFVRDPTVRRDRIRWLTGDTPAVAWYLAWIESVRVELNRLLFLGLFDYECHVAHYPPGGFYRRHLDAFRGGNNRLVSTVLYLSDVPIGGGGELVVYPAEETDDMVVAVAAEAAPADLVAPRTGRLVVFLSESIPHEVLPVDVDRWSIAGWFRRAGPPVPTVPVG